MQGLSYRGLVLVLAAAVLLSACAGLVPQGAEPTLLPPTLPVPEVPTDTSPKSDTYTVKAGDTLIRIAADAGVMLQPASSTSATTTWSSASCRVGGTFAGVRGSRR